MSKFIAGWLRAAAEVLEAELGVAVDLLPGAAVPAAGFTLTVEIAGAWSGSLTATVDEAAWSGLLAGLEAARVAKEQEGNEPGTEEESEAPPTLAKARAEWERLFSRICVAAAAELTGTSGAACEVAMISPEEMPAAGMGYQLRAGQAVVALVLADRVELAEAEPAAGLNPSVSSAPGWAEDRPSRRPAADEVPKDAAATGGERGPAAEMRGIDLLLGVELEASLRFGSREMALSDLLALGPGDVIQLDRALADPVELIIGDKIVARGEVVLVNGNFGLQIAEVAEPRKSLESIRCLF